MKAVKLPSGNWRIQVYLGKTEDGKKIRKSFTGENRKQVEAEAHQFLISHEEVNRSDSFGVMAERFIEDRRAVLSPSTIRSYIHIAERLKTRSVSFWDGSAYSISKYDMQGVIDHLVEDGLSPKTVLNYHGFISAVLDYSEAPSPQVRLPQKKRPNLNIPDSEKVKAVLDAAKDTEIELPIMLAAFGPLRRGEICALKWSDIQGYVIHVQRDCVLSPEKKWEYKLPKTLTSDRFVTMPGFVMEKLKEIPKADPDGFIFDMNPNQITDKFRRLLKREGIEDFRFHDLRHFCCSYLHGMNVPDIYIMQRSGHATTATLRQIYTHTLQNQSEEETKKIISGFNSIAK